MIPLTTQGLCLRLAQEKGVAHAQLPISQFVSLSGRRILSINQVFEILLHFTESRSWQDAFVKAIPSRKGVQVIPSEQSQSQIERTNTAHLEKSECETSRIVEESKCETSQVLEEPACETSQVGD